MRSPKTTVSFHHGLPPHCSLVLSSLPLVLDIVLDLPKDLVRMCLHACVLKSLSLVAHQALLSMEFSRQEYWHGLPFPPPGGLPNPKIKPSPPVSPALQADSLPTEPLGKHFVGGEQRGVILCTLQQRFCSLHHPLSTVGSLPISRITSIIQKY